MQIIINRCTVVMFDKQKAQRIKWGAAILVTCVNISVFCIWIPAHVGDHPKYDHTPIPMFQPISNITALYRMVKINQVWDRIEKVILLVVDALLNWYFIRVVRKRLVAQGHTKYDKLVTFNVRIIAVSLAMDVSVAPPIVRIVELFRLT